MEVNTFEYRLMQIKRIILIVAAVFVLAAIGFSYFKISSEGHAALREGKNVKLALDMLAVEYHGIDQSVYNSNQVDGLSKGVRERLLEVVESENPQISLISYNKKKNEVLCLSYENDQYRVLYTKDEEGEHWRVDYLVHIQKYDD